MIELTFHRESVCMGDDAGNGIQQLKMADDAVLEDLIYVILHGSCDNEWPIPYTGGHAMWAINSNVGILAYVCDDAELVLYPVLDKKTALKNLGLVSTFGAHVEYKDFFDMADYDDIDELIRMRIAFITEEAGSMDEHQQVILEEQLARYFERNLHNRLVAFVAKDKGRIVSVAYLLIIEMPANLRLSNGLYGEVLNVYTEQAYRGKGLCTKLLRNLIEFAKSKGLGCIDLSATDKGYGIYKRLGFIDKKTNYTEMRLTIN